MKAESHHAEPRQTSQPPLLAARYALFFAAVYNNRSATNRHARSSQMRIDRLEDALSEAMRFQEMTELADRGLVRDPLAAKIDPDERPHRVTIVEGLFDARIAQIEPVLEEIYPQHPLDTDRRTSGPFPNRIVTLNDLADALPRDHLVHLVEKLRTPRRFGITFKTGSRKRDLLVRHELNCIKKQAPNKSGHP